MTLNSYKIAIAKLLKAYHKKWDWQGRPIAKKKKKRSKKTNRKRSKLSKTC
jgi:hypothetical protein